MGEFEVPTKMLYGAQTARAVANFTVSGEPLSREMLEALGMIKLAAAAVNKDLGHIDGKVADAIAEAAREVIEGRLDAHFPIDVFQTGSGTSSNMNTNEVISNRAIQILGGKVGSKDPVHPNDHVNFGQSSNDVFPTAIHVAAALLIHRKLKPALTKLHKALQAKAKEFDDVVKIGRTHLQDATPIRLGQEFSGFAAQVSQGLAALEHAAESLRQLAIGGTAVGTGINTEAQFGRLVAKQLSKMSGIDFVETPNHFAAQASQDVAVQLSGTLKRIAVGLMKVANDIRWLGSGPRLGLGELEIPAVQPGSSIMPGKVNPVIAESLLMACAQVIGNDAAITVGGIKGNFELNTMLPLIARNLHEQLRLLAAAVEMFTEKLVVALRAHRDKIARMNEQSLALATALAPHIGYDKAAEIAKESHRTGKTVREIATEWQVLPADELERALDLKRQTKPGL